MAISDTYENYLLEKIIKELLLAGETPTIEKILSEYEELTNGQDVSEPLFDATSSHTETLENASAEKQNDTNNLIKQDLTVAYKELFTLTDKIVSSLDRWRTESALLENRTKKVDRRIQDLYELARHKNQRYISDDFVDTSKVDLEDTTAFVDLQHQTVAIDTSLKHPSRIYLDDVMKSEALFTVLNRRNFIAARIAPEGELENAFDDMDNFWQTRVTMSKNTFPVNTELLVRVADEPITLTKIFLKLHAGNNTSSIYITPMLSVDNINFSQLPVDDVTASVNDKYIWTFSGQQAKWVKFIFQKAGHDSVDGVNYIYEFGAEEISFFSEEYDLDSTQELISHALSVEESDKSIFEFSTVKLETCERVPTNTDIDYYVSVSNDSSFPDLVWTRIDPGDREGPLYPDTIKFSTLENLAVGGAKVSYDAYHNTDINPALAYTLVDLSGNTLIESSELATESRYKFGNSNDRILDHVLHGDLNIVNGSVEIFRNVGIPNSSSVDWTEETRNVRAGWSFSDPYYSTVVEVINSDSIKINFGSEVLIIDDKPRRGVVTLSKGLHKVKIHKDNWVNIPGLLTTLDDIKANDSLYPFNHKHLIEGYDIIDPANPYQGVDLFAEIYMKEVSVSDMLTNVQPTDYTRFAIDFDFTANSNFVFVVKSDENNSDFMDEMFTIRFDLKDQLYKYVKLKAILSTKDQELTPNLDGYRLKLSR
jgi:hypothetical protein